MSSIAHNLALDIIAGSRLGARRGDEVVAVQIKKVVFEYLRQLNFNGDWKVVPIKKTGIHTTERVFYRNVFSYKPLKLTYGVRPGSRDTSWNVHLIPPPEYKFSEVMERVEAYRDRVKAEDDAATDDTVDGPAEGGVKAPNVSIGQLFRARVIGHAKFGLEVEGPDKRFQGFIPRQNLGANFNDINLTQFKVGKAIEIQIADIKNGIPILTYLEPLYEDGKAKKRDMFNTVLCPDGMLLLTDFLEKPDRVLMVCKVIGTMQEGVYPQPVSFSDAYNLVQDELKHFYGATIVRNMDVARMLRRLAEQEILGEKWLKAFADPSDDETITGIGLREFAWNRVNPQTAVEVTVPDPIEWDQPEPETTEPTEDFPILAPVEEPQSEPEEEITIDMPEVSQPTIVEQAPIVLPVFTQQDTQYIRKFKRLNDVKRILGQIEDLKQEQSDLENWLGRFEEKSDMGNLKAVLPLIMELL